MKKNKLVWTGLILLIGGLVLMAVGFSCGAKISAYVTGQGVVLEDGSLNQRTDNQLPPFQNLDIQLGDAELRLIPSDHYGIDMCYYDKRYEPQFQIKDGTLTVRDRRQSEGSGWVLMSINLLNTKNNTVDIYYEAGQALDQVKINNGVSTVWMDGLKAKEMALDNDIGDVTMKNMELDQLTLHQDIGVLRMKNNRINRAELRKNSGDLSVDQLTGDEMKAKIDIGNINFTESSLKKADFTGNLGEMVLQQWRSNGLKMTSGNGAVRIQGHLAGENRIQSNLGDVSIQTDLTDERYALNVKTSLGALTVDGAEVSGNIARQADTGNSLFVDAACGNIDLSFGQ